MIKKKKKSHSSGKETEQVQTAALSRYEPWMVSMATHERALVDFPVMVFQVSLI